MGLFSPHAVRVDAKSELIKTLITYHDSGAYQQDLAMVGQQALQYLTSLPPRQAKQALVLDIDETSLANDWPKLVEPGKGYDFKAWDAWIHSAQAPAIQPTLELFNAARLRGLEIFFITGRFPCDKASTETNLKRAGYGGWTEIIVEPVWSENPLLTVFPEAAAYKTAARSSLVARGYRIVLSVGDQLSDLKGGYADKTFQLPNPFYTIV